MRYFEVLLYNYKAARRKINTLINLLQYRNLRAWEPTMQGAKQERQLRQLHSRLSSPLGQSLCVLEIRVS